MWRRVDHSSASRTSSPSASLPTGIRSPPSTSRGDLLTASPSSPNATNNILIHETHIFRPNLLNDFRASYARVGAGGRLHGQSGGSRLRREHPVPADHPRHSRHQCPGFFNVSSGTTNRVGPQLLQLQRQRELGPGRHSHLIRRIVRALAEHGPLRFPAVRIVHVQRLFSGAAISDFLPAG